MRKITIQQVYTLLLEEDLLKEIVTSTAWHYTFPEELASIEFADICYDSRKAAPGSLFFCKGLNFKEDFLRSAVEEGIDTYIAETPYEVTANGIIVTDIHKAMAVIAQVFFDNPQEKLTTIAITGTKGKTTTAYFTKAVLNKMTDHKVAFFSSEEITVDGRTYEKSHLTTPEALDLFAMMAQAVENGLTHLVMEVSSQAYKNKRVYGITFDIGVFLNISPDHISPIEHPNFEDYLYCKRQLIENSRQMILNRETAHFELLKEICEAQQRPVVTFGRYDADYIISEFADPKTFAIHSENDVLDLSGNYELALLGDFNHENAAAALLAASFAGASKELAQKVLPTVSVPGRMNLLEKKNGALIFIDYAHNYLSIKSISELAKQLRPEGRLIMLTGSAGGKAENRRSDIGRAISEFTDITYLTNDDPDYEDPQKIAQDIAHAITNPDVKIIFELDRKKAIQEAIAEAKSEDVVVLAGKGTECYMKINGKLVPYTGDFEIAKQIVAE